jgi:hypothetical protein
MVEWLAGNRIRGTNAERTTTSGIGNAVGGWVEVGRTTLGSAGDTISVSSLADKRYYMFLFNDLTVNTRTSAALRFNSDTGTNYATRRSRDGGTDSASPSATAIGVRDNSYGYDDGFAVGYVSNLTAKEKLLISHFGGEASYPAGTPIAPRRQETVGKWVPTTASDVINEFTMVNGESGDYKTGTEMVVLGWDPADTHTDNFWEPLGSTTLATAGDNIEVTFTAKKYLMVKLYRKQTGAADARWTFNNDGGANYANRTSAGGGTDSTSINQNYFTQYTYDSNEPSYSSTMIVNTAGAEKLAIQHEVGSSGAGAGYAPHRSESVFKWANTSDQITTIDITNSKSGSYDVGSIIEVWGHD